jgi:hypothetical protein
MVVESHDVYERRYRDYSVVERVWCRFPDHYILIHFPSWHFASLLHGVDMITLL